ncbi:uncharacterized protein [Diabrotica undecimpunctata]|uniref:uncharacterized protein n=1 Tax=Diabrotica undecimpunctata TaxID=50387 RepID=UPI003B639770
MARREVSASEFRRMTYEKQQKYLQQFIDDIDEEVDKNIENQESDEDYVSQSKPDGDEASDVEDVFTDINNKIEIDTDGDDSSDEYFDDFQESSSQSDVLVAKDKTIWQRKPFTASRTLKRNLLREKTGPVRSTKTLSIRDTFKCVFSDVMCDIIIRETNRKANSVCENYNVENPDKPRNKGPSGIRRLVPQLLLGLRKTTIVAFGE